MRSATPPRASAARDARPPPTCPRAPRRAPRQRRRRADVPTDHHLPTDLPPTRSRGHVAPLPYRARDGCSRRRKRSSSCRQSSARSRRARLARRVPGASRVHGELTVARVDPDAEGHMRMRAAVGMASLLFVGGPALGQEGCADQTSGTGSAPCDATSGRVQPRDEGTGSAAAGTGAAAGGTGSAVGSEGATTPGMTQGTPAATPSAPSPANAPAAAPHEDASESREINDTVDGRPGP